MSINRNHCYGMMHRSNSRMQTWSVADEHNYVRTATAQNDYHQDTKRMLAQEDSNREQYPRDRTRTDKLESLVEKLVTSLAESRVAAATTPHAEANLVLDVSKRMQEDISHGYLQVQEVMISNDLTLTTLEYVPDDEIKLLTTDLGKRAQLRKLKALILKSKNALSSGENLSDNKRKLLTDPPESQLAVATKKKPAYGSIKETATVSKSILAAESALALPVNDSEEEGESGDSDRDPEDAGYALVLPSRSKFSALTTRVESLSTKVNKLEAQASSTEAFKKQVVDEARTASETQNAILAKLEQMCNTFATAKATQANEWREHGATVHTQLASAHSVPGINIDANARKNAISPFALPRPPKSNPDTKETPCKEDSCQKASAPELNEGTLGSAEKEHELFDASQLLWDK